MVTVDINRVPRPSISSNFFCHLQKWTGDTGRLTEFLDITTCQEAKEWVAEKLSGEDYEKIFGTPDEGKLISVSAETLAIIDKYREERNLTYDQAIKKLITK